MNKLVALLILTLLAPRSIALETPLPVALNKPFALEPNGGGTYLARYIPANWNLEFVRVVSDSRCPVNVDCVWAGDAELELRVFKGKQNQKLTLHTGLEPRSATMMGFKLTLQRLEPKRGMPGKPRAVFVLSKP
jgi:hypothetical protein